MRLEEIKGELHLCLIITFCECAYECSGYGTSTNKYQYLLSLGLRDHLHNHRQLMYK